MATNFFPGAKLGGKLNPINWLGGRTAPPATAQQQAQFGRERVFDATAGEPMGAPNPAVRQQMASMLRAQAGAPAAPSIPTQQMPAEMPMQASPMPKEMPMGKMPAPMGAPPPMDATAMAPPAPPMQRPLMPEGGAMAGAPMAPPMQMGGAPAAGGPPMGAPMAPPMAATPRAKASMLRRRPMGV